MLPKPTAQDYISQLTGEIYCLDVWSKQEIQQLPSARVKVSTISKIRDDISPDTIQKYGWKFKYI